MCAPPQREGPRVAANATDSALEYAVTLPDVTVTPGKEVVEFSVVHTSKGAAIDALARASAAADAWLYLGDDVTDESVFARLGDRDVGIKVGEATPPPATASRGPTRSPRR